MRTTPLPSLTPLDLYRLGHLLVHAFIHHVQIHQGLLYVWPDASEDATTAADCAPLPIIGELDETDEWEPRTDWFMRDVPISMETVVENVSAQQQNMQVMSLLLS
jgi:hypothetical protein